MSTKQKRPNYKKLLGEKTQELVVLQVELDSTQKELTTQQRISTDLFDECKRLKVINAQLNEQNEEMAEYPELDPGWFPFTDMCRRWLKHYPKNVFTGVTGEPGALFVVKIREAMELLDDE